MGNWIGGDRDGNPFVTAETLRDRVHAPERDRAAPLPDAGARARCRALGLGDLQASRPQMQALADASRDANPHRADEPYRRALTGIYARLAATLHGPHRRRGAAPRGRAAARLPAGRGIPRRPANDRGLAASRITPRRWSPPRLAPLMRAVQVFGFHLATVDLRQSSDKHEAVVAELLAVARIEADYCALAEAARRALLLRVLERRAAAARRAGERADAYSEASRNELAIFETAAAMRAPLRRRGAPPIHHLAHRKRQRPARGAGAAEGSGPAARHARRRDATTGADRLAAVRDHRRPAQRGADHARVLRPARHRRADAALGRRAGRDARLQRQQQGRRQLHQQLGALPRRDRAGRAVRRAAPNRTASRCACSTAAAARSGAAAARATRRSWRSRRAR